MDKETLLDIIYIAEPYWRKLIHEEVGLLLDTTPHKDLPTLKLSILNTILPPS